MRCAPRHMRDTAPRTRDGFCSRSYPARAVALREYVREGLRFALRYGALSIDPEGGLLPAHNPVAPRRPSAQGDLRQVIAASQRVGRWLTKLDLPATAFALLGVRP